MTQNLPLPQRLEQRLKALRDELETGQKMLADVEARRAELQQTILRISGAVQVLEELLAAEPSAVNGVAAAEASASAAALVEADA
jgi:prefoldin subunit 5